MVSGAVWIVWLFDHPLFNRRGCQKEFVPRREDLCLFTDMLSTTVLKIRMYPIRMRTSMDGKLPSFVVMKFPSTRMGRTRRQMHATLGGGNCRFPPGEVAIGFTPTSVGGRKTNFSMPITTTILTTFRVVDPRIIDEIVVTKRVNLSKRVRKVSKVLPVILYTEDLNDHFYMIPCRGLGRKELVESIPMTKMGGLQRLIRYLGGPRPCLGERVRRRVPSVVGASVKVSFSSVRKRRKTGETTRVTMDKFRGLLLVKPPKANGAVLTEELPAVVPKLNFRRGLRLAEVCDVTKLLSERCPLVSRQPFHDPRRADAPRTVTKNKHGPEPNRVALTRGNMLFLSRVPRFSETDLRLLQRPVRSGIVRVTETDKACGFPTSFVLYTTVGPYPYNCCPSLGEYAYATNRVARCVKGVDHPLLSEVSVDARMPPISFSRLRYKEGKRGSTTVEGEIRGMRGVRRRQCGSRGVGFGKRLGDDLLSGFYPLASDTSQLLTETFRGVTFDTESCREVLGMTEAVTSVRKRRVVTNRRVKRTLSCETFSGSSIVGWESIECFV